MNTWLLWSYPMDQWLKYMIYHDCHININPYMGLQNYSMKLLHNIPSNIVTQTTND